MRKTLFFAAIAILLMGNCAFAGSTPPAAPWNSALPAPGIVIVPSNVDVGNPPGLNISNRDNREDFKTKPWDGSPVRFAPYPGSSSFVEIYEGF